MIEHPDRISIADCVEGHVYLLLSRNLVLGVFRRSSDEGVVEHMQRFDTGFVGIREKFGHRYLFEEYHWDCGEPYGTANPLEDLGPLPEGITAQERLGEEPNAALFAYLDSLAKGRGVTLEAVQSAALKGLSRKVGGD